MQREKERERRGTHNDEKMMATPPFAAFTNFATVEARTFMPSTPSLLAVCREREKEAHTHNDDEKMTATRKKNNNTQTVY